MPKSKVEQMTRRLLDAAAVLWFNGIITDGERATVHRRMLKWKASQATKSKSAPKR